MYILLPVILLILVSITIIQSQTLSYSQSSNLIPDVKSNISQLMTPDLPDKLDDLVIQDPLNRTLQIENNNSGNGVDNENANNLNSLSKSAPVVESNTEIANLTSGWKNYTSEKLGFTIDYPNNISIQKDGPETRFDLYSNLEIGDLNDDGFSITPQTLIVYSSDIKDIVKLTRDASLQFNSPNGFPILIEDITKMNITGDSGYSYLVSLIDNESEKSESVSNATFLKHNDIVYRFLFITNTSQYEYTNSIFNQMLKTIKWFEDEKLTALALSINQSEQMLRERNNAAATIETTQGPIKIQLYPDVAPNHVKNFQDLVSKGFYDGVVFHRIVPGFVIQTGDPNTKYDDLDREIWGTGGPGYTINPEFSSIPHERGILSMARTDDPNSAGSQFFIVLNNSNFLDNQYTVFGKVTEGMNIVDRIASLTTNSLDQPIVKDLARINTITLD